MESNHEQLVKALRCKRDDCEGCDLAFFDKDEGWMCQYAAKDDDAADAIEALQKRLVNALTALHLANEKMGYYGIQPYTEADGEDMISDWVKTLVHEELTIKEREYEALKADRDELATDLAAVGRALTSELEQQMPKRGVWIRIDKHTIQCPLCHRYLDLRGVNAGRGDANYCPNCGADMRAKMEGRE